jgi:tRNA-binding protein
MVTREQFEAVDIRVGTIIAVEPFPEMKKPSYKLKIDLWEEVWIKQSSSQLVALYSTTDLIGRQVLCVCNFPTKKMPWGFISEVLTTGLIQSDGSVVLVGPSQKVENGLRLA